MKVRALIIIICISNLIFTVNSEEIVSDKHVFYKEGILNENILYVGGEGENNYTKIQDAIDNSTNGYIIFVYNNEYFENLIINKKITLIGEDKNHTIINGNYSDTVIKITIDGISVNGFTLKNSKGDWESSVFEINSNNNSISNNIILCDSITKNDIAIKVKPYCNNNIFSCNKIFNSDRGFEINSCNNLIIGNIIRDCGQNSIWIHPDDNKKNICSNNSIINNTIYEIDDSIGWGYGIWIHRSIENRIIGNNISDKYFGIHVEVYSDNTTVRKNKIFNNRGYGIVIASAIGCNLSYNIIKENQEFGIGIFSNYGHDNIIYHNNIINNGNLNTFTRECKDIKWIENYYSDWIGLKFPKLDFLPYWIPKGTRLNGRIKIPRFSLSNIDWNPAKVPYEI